MKNLFIAKSLLNRIIRFLSVSYVIFCLFTAKVSAQVDVSGTIAGVTPVTYGTLKLAFDAINLGTHTGVITVNITASTTEAAVAAAPSMILNPSGHVSGASYTAINIQPTGVGPWTISGAASAGFPLIDFPGPDNVTINGLLGGVKSLTISNTTVSSTSGTGTIRFSTDATSNTITNCLILGSATMAAGTNGGNISFASAAITTGNDNNTISNCDLGPAGANLSSKLVHFSGSSNTDPGTANSGNSITNCNFFDFFAPSAASCAIDVNSGTVNLSITNNRFYQTATRTQVTTASTHSAIRISNGSGFNYTVTGNTVGYASNSQTGIYTLVLIASSAFTPITVTSSTTGSNSIQNNTVAAMAVSGAASGTSSSAPFRAIYLGAGVHNVGDVTGNIIGSQSATGSITYTSSSASSSEVMGIYNFSSSATNISNNTVGGITTANSSTGAAIVYGIRVNTATGVATTMTNNKVGGTVANSIQSTSAATGSLVHGIRLDLSNGSVVSNTVRNLTAAGGTGTTTSASVAGIVFVSTSANNTVSRDSIYNLANTNTSAAVTITGIQYTSSTGTNLISRNFIHSLSTPSTAGIINGIQVSGGTATYQNNMIRLGIDGAGSSNTASVQINGVNEISGTDNFFHNSIYIGGSSVVSGAINTFAFTSATTTTRSFRDNIFFNARSNTSGTGKHYAVRVAGTVQNPAGLTINNNDYFANGTGGVFGSYNGSDVTSLADWKFTGAFAAGKGPAQDVGSFNSDPAFQTPTGTSSTVDLHINPSISTVVEGNGSDVGVTDDFDGQTRSTLTPVDIGADAGNFTGVDLSAPSIVYTALNNTCGAVDATLTATISDATGVKIAGGLGPRIYYKRGVNGTFTSVAGTITSGNFSTGTWSFAITQASTGGAVNDTIFYYVIAQDSGAASVNIASNPSGVIATDVNTITTPPASPNSYKYLPSLGGPYTVGSGGNYLTITLAVAAYNTSCLTSAVTFNLTDASYAGETFPITINNNTFASATNTLTINTTVASTVITGSSASGIFVLNGADFVTINGSTSATVNTVCPDVSASRDLTITNTNAGTSSAVIWLQTASSGVGTSATNNTIKNCIIRGSAATAATLIGVGSGSTSISTSSLGTGNNNNSYINNDIGKCQFGIYSQGASAGNKNSGTVINLNLINSASPNNVGIGGILVGFDNGTNVNRNTVSEITGSGDLFAITIGMGTSLSTTITGGNEVTNAIITKNTIGTVIGTGTNSAVGIALGAATSGTSLIANNMVYGVSTNCTSPDYGAGITLGGGTGSTTQVYYNSVVMQGTITGATAATQTSTCLAVTNTSGITLDNRNNIYVNTQIGNTSSTTRFACVALAYSSTLGNYTGLTSDHNNYYVAGAGPGSYQVGLTGGVAGTARITLADWTAQTGRDGAGSAPNASATTLQINPVFTSSTNLHLVFNDATNLPFNDGAIVVSVTDDIDCNSRATDIGADEFNPPACTGASASTASASPATICGTSGSASLSTTAVNTGIGLSYLWQSSSTGLTGSFSAAPGANNTASYNTGTISTTTYYRLVVTCTPASLSDTSNIVTLAVNPIPSASISGSPTTYCANLPTTFSAVTNGTSPSYVWKQNGTSNGITTSTFSPTNSGSYSVTVTALGCSATSASIAVIVNEAVTISSFTVTPSPACAGSTLTLVSTSDGGTDSASFTASANSGVISVPIPDASATGVSTPLVLSGGSGNIGTNNTVQVTFSIDRPTGWLPDMDIFLVGPANCGTLELSTDNGTGAALASAYTNTVLKTPSVFPSITTGTQPFTGNFSPEGTLAGTPNLTGAVTGSYVLPATNLTGCPVNGSWSLFVGDDATTDIGTITNFQLVITGLTATKNFTAVFTGPTVVGAPVYSGANNSVATATTTAGSSGTYSVTVTGANGCSLDSTKGFTVQTISDAPVVTSPICAGATTVSGTSTEADGTSIDVYVNGLSVGTTTVTSNAWTKSGLTALAGGDLIKAKATASGECESGFSLITVTVQFNSDAPVVTSPICAGATSVSGTSTEADGTSIDVYVNGFSVGTTTVTGNAWTKSGLTALAAGDLVKAKATASGECESGFSFITVTVVNCAATVKVKALIQGYYDGAGKMKPVLWKQLEEFGPSLPGTYSQSIVDTVIIKLLDESTFATVDSFIAIIDTDGNVTGQMSVATIGTSYYIGFLHRNSLFTCSAYPVLLQAVTSYDFRLRADSAFGIPYLAGFPYEQQYNFGDGFFGIYSGDVNQDEYIDTGDVTVIDNDNLSGLFLPGGYWLTDINGDGYVDTGDVTPADNNNSAGVLSQHP